MCRAFLGDGMNEYGDDISPLEELVVVEAFLLFLSTLLSNNCVLQIETMTGFGYLLTIHDNSQALLSYDLQN